MYNVVSIRGPEILESQQFHELLECGLQLPVTKFHVLWLLSFIQSIQYTFDITTGGKDSELGVTQFQKKIIVKENHL